MPFFDAYISVDWSASNTPILGKNSIWVGELCHADGINNQLNLATRNAATAHVYNRLLDHVGLNRRILVGFDFAYGYPHGFAQALGLPHNAAAWVNIWQYFAGHIQDNIQNNNNRFQFANDINNIISGGGIGPFWGRPNNIATPHLETGSPRQNNARLIPFPANNGVLLGRLRLTEAHMVGVQETWKLWTAGNVGSQVLTGIPRVHSLRHHANLAHCSQVWPFETGFALPNVQPGAPLVLHAEIWPSIPPVYNLFNQLINQGVHPRDRAQVRAMCEWAHGLDLQNQLGALFNAPANLNDQQLQHCIQEEGWILGV